MKKGLSKGFALVEIIVAVSIFAAAVVSIVAAFSFYFRLGIATTEKAQASYLAGEALEAIRYIRDEGWAAQIVPLTNNTEYHLAWNNGWQTTTTPQIIDGQFTRTVTLLEVYRRDSDSDIVATSSSEAKTLDPGTKRVNVTVSWKARTGTSTVTVATYLSNIFND